MNFSLKVHQETKSVSIKYSVAKRWDIVMSSIKSYWWLNANWPTKYRNKALTAFLENPEMSIFRVWVSYFYSSKNIAWFMLIGQETLFLWLKSKILLLFWSYLLFIKVICSHFESESYSLPLGYETYFIAIILNCMPNTK